MYTILNECKFKNVQTINKRKLFKAESAAYKKRYENFFWKEGNAHLAIGKRN